MSVENLVSYIKNHPCLSHPIFNNWAEVKPSSEVVAALFHQIRSFCDSTRPIHNLAQGLTNIGLSQESSLVQQIGESEENHRPELATMAGYIINKMSKAQILSDLYDQHDVENYLKKSSDALLGNLPGYDKQRGLLIQNIVARNVFEGRKNTNKDAVYKNLGVTLALEITSNRYLIPGEKHCLIDAKLYDVSLDDKEMHYLHEHWGEAGAEAMHEQSAKDALSSVMTADTEKLIFAGAKDFLDSLLALWDVLNTTLLGSGHIDKSTSVTKSTHSSHRAYDAVTVQ